jgi:hypothetical protein
MNNLPTTQDVEKLLLEGNLANLTADQKLAYYKKVCETLGLNPLTKPFDFIKFQGKEVLYAGKGCAEQLRQIHKISIVIKDAKQVGDIFLVIAEATTGDGRIDSSTGAISLAGLKGDALANAFMKCETKAKRRVTLSICGLNMLDETEVETIPGAQFSNQATPTIAPQQPTAIDGNTDPNVRGYRIPFGKFKSRSLEEVGYDQLISYVDYIEKQALKDNKPITGQVLEFVNRVNDFVNEQAGQSEFKTNAPNNSGDDGWK